MELERPEAELAQRRSARLRRGLAWTVTVVYAVLLGMAMARHEMWRDETQAWLLARDAPSWWGVFHAIRYEGHPGLWHALLWPVARLSWNPVWMQVAHGAVASAGVWVFVRHAPFWWPVRVLLPFGYVLFFEWGVIARNYAPSVLLLFLFCAAFARRWRAFPWAAAALAAACHTNVHALLLVLVLTPLLMVDYAVAVAGRWRDAHRCKGRVVAAFALVLLGIATAVRQVQPPDDAGFATGWTWEWHEQRAALAALTLLRAHAPVPVVEEGRYWNTCRPLQRLVGDEYASERLPVVAGNVLLAACGIAVLMLARRPWFLLHWTLGTLALTVFLYAKYMGSLRHHAFHWLWAVVVLWLALQRGPWETGRQRLDRILGHVEWAVVQALLLVGAAFQLWGCAVAVRADRQHVFSNAKAAAAWLRTEGLLAGNACFAGQRGPHVSAVVGYAELPRIYYTGRNEWGSYVVWDRQYDRSLQGRRLAEELRRLRGAESNDLVFLSSQPLEPWAQPDGLRDAASFNVPNANDSIWIYVWPQAGAHTVHSVSPTVPGDGRNNMDAPFPPP
jgi:hypothetical protein